MAVLHARSPAFVSPWTAVGLVLLSVACVKDSPSDSGEALPDSLGRCAPDNSVVWLDVEPVFSEHCTECHSSELEDALRQGAPVGITTHCGVFPAQQRAKADDRAEQCPCKTPYRLRRPCLSGAGSLWRPRMIRLPLALVRWLRARKTPNKTAPCHQAASAAELPGGLLSVRAAAPDEVWIVGNSPEPLDGTGPYLLEYNGQD